MSGGPRPGQREVHHFGAFSLDLEARLLTRDGTPIPLTPKAFDILRVLVQNAGRAVPRAELLEGVWPDAVVETGNLDWYVSNLRKSLGEDEGKAIETVRGFGYRFTVAVRRERVRTGPVSSIAVRPVEVDGDVTATMPAPRRTAVLAVMPFDDLVREASTAWVSTALAEVIGAELTGVVPIEVVPRESVAAVLAELRLPLGRTLSQSTLTRLRERLGTDLAVTGSFLVAGPEKRLRVDASLQDCRSGRVAETYQETGTVDTIIDVATSLGQRLKQRLRGGW